ncbi:MAG: glycosyltransferase family 4 protein, partial [Solirubrobacteraceae bacterium]
MPHRVLMGLLFFPRGGSAHVARNLARRLPSAGWDVRVVSGSGPPPGDARAFYDGVDVVPVDMTAALDAPDPLLADPPLHPSYEERDDAPDKVFAALDDRHYAHQVDAWCRILRGAGAAEADVLHLHHLTPLNEAAARVAPDVPVVGHLHGTELLMLEEGEGRWPHAAAWARRMRGWAQRCERLIVLSASQVGRVEELLGVDPDRCVRIPNGFDPDVFDAHPVDRAAFWHRQLGEAFTAEQPVLLYVGRFTAVKRLPVLIEAYARARAHFDRRAPLVLLGGYPGEWEGEHPLEAIRRTGAEDVFLAGWHGHDELPDFLAASEAVVLPSVREQFGQVLVEAMACGLPPIAVDRFGPAEIVTDGDCGWLVEPDDEEALAGALA